MTLIKKFLEKDLENKISINVIGDPMVDEWYDVAVDRISPEFPIPVYKSVSQVPVSGMLPGGAANVAYQFKHFNVDLQLITLLSSLSQVVFDSRGIKTGLCKIVDNMFMPVKKRIYSQDIPLTRWDFERENFGLDDIKKHLLDLEIPDSDLNIFSDYNKGIFSYPWFRKYFKNSKSIVDPKNENIDIWQDCSVFKPNMLEARQLSEKKNWKDQVDFFINSIKCDSVVITQGANGVVGKNEDYFEFRPENNNIKPQSVIGAGDCFVCFMSMALVRGFTLQEATQIAYIAGSIYVQRKMNRPISPAELIAYAGNKIVDCPKILAKRNFKLAFTNGCFDMFHAGHVSSLEFASKQGDKLCVAINSDESIRRIKGTSRPIIPLAERVKLLQSLEVVDFIIVFDENDPYQIIKDTNPDVLVKGSEYEDKLVVGRDLVKDVRFAPNYPGFSTTNIINKIKIADD